MYVEVKDIDKRYGQCHAADKVSFGIEKGRMAALLGPSGSGKTTLLRMIAGLEQQDSGDVKIEGKVVNEVEAGARGIGFVFQNYALFRYMTVYENIAFGLRVKKKSKAQIRHRVEELLELVGLAGLEKRYPDQLSGGQRQRVAFARALAPDPQLLLLDEPFAAVDAKVRKELRSWLKEMISQVGITSIFVTHDQDEAVEVADDILIVNEGRLEQMGTPAQIYKNPKNAFVAQFIGSSSVVENLSQFKGFADVPQGSQAILRPEFVEAFKSDNQKYHALLPATEEGVIQEIAFRGSNLELTLSVNGALLKTNRSLERRPVQVGEKLCVLVYRGYVLRGENARMYENTQLEGVDIESL